MADSIQRFSSRQEKLHESALLPHLREARRYYRIAGYFTSSLFEIAGEELEHVEDVRIVCNADVSAEDLAIANPSRAAQRVREAELLGRLDERIEVDALRNRQRYQRLEKFLAAHPDGIRVAPEERCGFLHGKAGLIERHDGQRLAFIGSMNETRAGWSQHYEILWQDYSPEGVAWVEEEFDYLWRHAVVLPQVVLKEVRRRTHRVEVDLDAIEADEEVAPAALNEAPMYREGFALSPWQRAFVGEALKHWNLFGQVRLLVADEVGLGKTLSLATALLLLTLKADQGRGPRQRSRPAVIFAPKSLIEQWQTELMDKLGITTGRWDSLRKVWVDPEDRPVSPQGSEEVARCPFRIGILSTGILTQPTRERAVLERMTFDTLVLDESHKAREKKIPGRQNEPNELLKFMEQAAGKAKHVLLGTATPMQTEFADLWAQLRILNQAAGFVLGDDFARWRGPDPVVPLLTGEDPAEDPEVAWKYLKNPLPPIDPADEGHIRMLISQIRNDLGIPDGAFRTQEPFAEVSPDVRQDFEFLLQGRESGNTFFQRHNPLVRHIVLRKREDLEEAGLLERVGVNLHPDPDYQGYQPGYPALFAGKALFTTDAFQEAYEAAEAS